MKITSAARLRKKNFKTYQMDDIWARLFGKELPFGHRVFFSGKAKCGKTTLAFEFAEWFQINHGKALILCSEEGHDFNVQSRLDRMEAEGVHIAELERKDKSTFDELTEVTSSGKPKIAAYKLIVIDSIQEFSLTLSQYRELISMNRTAIWVGISQLNNKGKTGLAAWEHDVDALVTFKDGWANVTSRLLPNPIRKHLFDINNRKVIGL